MKSWKKWKTQTKFEKNRTKPGTVLSETVLSGDSLYIALFFDDIFESVLTQLDFKPGGIYLLLPGNKDR